MLDFITLPLANFVINTVAQFSYAGVFTSMLLQSACVPIPSEIILPFAGFMISQKEFAFIPTLAASVFGCLTGGSLIFYLASQKGDKFVRCLIKKYGKYLLIKEKEMDEAEERFEKYGEIIVFVGRMLPVVRTFLALPAGLAHMDYKKFVVFSFLGDLIWSSLLIYIGLIMGQNWHQLSSWFHKFDLLIVLAGVLGVFGYIRHKLKK